MQTTIEHAMGSCNRTLKSTKGYHETHGPWGLPWVRHRSKRRTMQRRLCYSLKRWEACVIAAPARIAAVTVAVSASI
jgi:hypothetical protein